MKYKVQLFKNGFVFDCIVIAASTFEAAEIALIRNPNATVIFTTAIF